MQPIDTSARAGGLPPQTAATPAPAAGSGALDTLQHRAAHGPALTPVESGLLARLVDEHRHADAGGAAVVGAAAGAAAGARPARTAADFTLTNATAQDKADLTAALKYLATSPAAAAFLATVPKGAKIHIIHDGNDSYNPRTNVVNWDPRSGLAVSNGTGNQSAALGLLHELDHRMNGLANPKPTGDAYDNTEEKRVITGLETTVAKQLHEPVRFDHRGTAVTLGSSTAHTTFPAK